MFSKQSKIENFKNAETVIGSSVKVKGNFHGQGDIVIEGSLEGSLKTIANVFIGEKAKVVANVEANDLVIHGNVKGNLKVKNFLSLGGTAEVVGDIQYSSISIETGAIIEGTLNPFSQELNRKKDSGKPDTLSEEKLVE